MSRKESIWLICKYASPDKYFFGTRHFYLAEEWVKNGFDVTIFTSNSSHLTDDLPKFKANYLIEFIEGIRTIWINLPRFKNPSSIIRIFSWILFEAKIFWFDKKQIPKPKIIIVSSLSILSIISGYYYSKKYQARFILEIRDIWPLSIIHLGGYSKINPFIFFLSWLEAFGYRNADVIIGTMPNLEEHVRNVEPNYKMCYCIPQGIKREFLDLADPLPVGYVDMTFTKGTFKIGYAGTINKNNPIEILLDVVNLIPANLNVEVYILGKGTMLNYYKKKYSDCKQIKFVSPIPKRQVATFLKHMDVCFDSIDSEIAKYGLSRNKWIDYMNSGKPIICSYSGFPSMINEAMCGSFTRFGDKEDLQNEIMKYMQMSKEDRCAIGYRGKQFLIQNRLFETLAVKYQNFF